jgi:hypothetical protein
MIEAVSPGHLGPNLRSDYRVPKKVAEKKKARRAQMNEK